MVDRSWSDADRFGSTHIGHTVAEIARPLVAFAALPRQRCYEGKRVGKVTG